MNIRRFPRTLTRRDLMKRLGAAALALPPLELLGGESRALAAPGKSKFVVFVYTPNGVNESVFWPTGTETSFQLSSVLAAFTPFKDKMLILGPQMNGNLPAAGTGMAFLQPPPQHQAPVCLAARIGTGCTGHECTVTPGGHDGYGLQYLNQDTAVNHIDGPSIDQVIAMAVQGSSPFSSLNFGMHPVGGDTPSDINYAPDGTPLRRMASADEAWNRLFGAVMPGGGSTAAMTQAQADLRKHAALTDLLNNRFSALRTQVSAFDRNVIDHHLASLRTFEDRKTRLLMAQATQQTQCPQGGLGDLRVSGRRRCGWDAHALAGLHRSAARGLAPWRQPGPPRQIPPDEHLDRGAGGGAAAALGRHPAAGHRHAAGSDDGVLVQPARRREHPRQLRGAEHHPGRHRRLLPDGPLATAAGHQSDQGTDLDRQRHGRRRADLRPEGIRRQRPTGRNRGVDRCRRYRRRAPVRRRRRLEGASARRPGTSMDLAIRDPSICAEEEGC